MRVALYQCPPLPLDPAGNLQRLHQVALEARAPMCWCCRRCS
ncbi:putative amidohydrolase [Pseudomonas kilonensis]|nr:putative amidohydrolase [Pseudomonas kilonensis]